jgi:hypothetical protein
VSDDNRAIVQFRTNCPARYDELVEGLMDAPTHELLEEAYAQLVAEAYAADTEQSERPKEPEEP